MRALVVAAIVIAVVASLAGCNQSDPRVDALTLSSTALEERVHQLEMRQTLTDLSMVRTRSITLSSRKMQQLEDPAILLVVDDVKPELTGLRIKGRVLNQSTVGRENMKITLALPRANDDATVDFTVSVEPGVAAPFDAFVADVPVSSSSAVVGATIDDVTMSFHGTR